MISKEKNEANALMIHQAVRKMNKDFFSPNSMQLDLLRKQMQVIPVLVQWLYEEWHLYDVTLTKEKLIDSLNTCLNDDRVPITFVVLKDTTPIGMISLKRQLGSEFSDFSQDNLWMGSLQVVPEERNKGIGQELFKFAAIVTGRMGHKEMYFYTSNPNRVEWYIKRGAHVIEKRSFRNHTITIMEFKTKS